MAISLDSNGNLYAANLKNVTVYAPGATSVLTTISNGINTPFGFALGQSR
jgi:hypothetical protein